jgi:RNA polymerase sigma-70 factor (ECF subfamily)
MQTTSDEVLIARIAGGDRLAMQVLFARHHVRVYRFVLRLVRNEATAEDLISEFSSTSGGKPESSRAAPPSQPGC